MRVEKYNNFSPVFLHILVIKPQRHVIHTLSTCVFVGNQYFPNVINTMLIMCKVNKFFSICRHIYV